MRFSLRKPKAEAAVDPGFRRAAGLPYLDFLSALHEALRPNWYLEIGTRKGRSLERARGRSIAIDPEFRIATDVVRGLPELHLFQQTSDDFFAGGFLERNGIRIDLAFLDGMHLLENLLRDFINAERQAAAGAVFAIHDCMPWNAAMAERDRGRSVGDEWTGDVWKLLPILQAVRPDLSITVADCPPTGLVLVTNLDGANTALADSYAEIVAEMAPLTLGAYGPARLFDDFPFADSRILAAALAAPPGRRGRPAMNAAADPRQLRFLFRLPNPPPGKRTWGDYYFARSLADALERRGHAVAMEFTVKRPWLQRLRRIASRFRPDLDLILRGKVPFRRAGRPAIMWLISNSDAVPAAEIAAIDHVFVASSAHAARLRAEGHGNVSPLLQCTDATRFSPARRSELLRTRCLFVANRRDFERKALTYALGAGIPVTVWGRNWDGVVTPPGKVAGSHLDNAELGAWYASADVVLNDHSPDMRENDFTSNRVFDVLASGVPLLSDRAEDLPEGLAALVYRFTDAESFRAAFAAASNETEDLRARRRSAAEVVRTEHSFDARARVIEAQALTLAAHPAAA